MKYIKIFMLFSSFLTVSCSYKIPDKVGVIPQPNFIKYKNGAFEITDKTIIVIDGSEEANRIANELNSFFNLNFKINLNTSLKNKKNSIHLLLSIEETNKEAYKLKVSEKGISISGKSYQGIFYGVQTLKQLLTLKSIIKKPVLNYVNITDSPEFGWRGMMLDVSRHFIPKDSVKKVIDILAMHKMNKFHWHLVDGIGWRIQIDEYPELTKKGAWRKVKPQKKPWETFEATYKNSESEVYGGFYTKEDIKEVVAYAAERYIDVIPEIEMPGHSEAALQCYPEYSCDGSGKTGVYCAGNDGSFEFLQNIISEVIPLFPSEYIHIGGDEVGKSTWLKLQ